MRLFLFRLSAALEVEGRHIEDVRRHLDADPGFVIIGIVIPPAIIFFPGDLPCIQLRLFRLPGVQHFGKAFCLGTALEDVGAKADQAFILPELSSLRSSNVNRVCISPSRESMSGTVIALGDTSNASANAAVKSALGVRSSDSYCAIRTSAERSGNPSSVPRYFCVIPRNTRKKRILSSVAIALTSCKG